MQRNMKFLKMSVNINKSMNDLTKMLSASEVMKAM